MRHIDKTGNPSVSFSVVRLCSSNDDEDKSKTTAKSALDLAKPLRKEERWKEEKEANQTEQLQRCAENMSFTTSVGSSSTGGRWWQVVVKCFDAKIYENLPVGNRVKSCSIVQINITCHILWHCLKFHFKCEFYSHYIWSQNTRYKIDICLLLDTRPVIVYFSWALFGLARQGQVKSPCGSILMSVQLHFRKYCSQARLIQCKKLAKIARLKDIN